MQQHKGRGVVRLTIDETVYYLKRYQFVPHQFFKRHVRIGFHELAMIDWLNENGFAGPKVVARGHSSAFGFRPRMYFLMEEVVGELPLERYWRRHKEETDALLSALARHAGRLHDQNFYHRDFSERHLFVARHADDYSFRQIDVERACVGRPDEAKAAADLKTLAASVASETLQARLAGPLLEDYLSVRRNSPDRDTFMSLYEKAPTTKTF